MTMQQPTLHHDEPHANGPPFASDTERLASFERALDALRHETEAKLGAEDVAYIRAVRSVATGCEIAGRTLIHASLEPISFGMGVVALWVHKTLELIEVGHNVLHGTYDHLTDDRSLHSECFCWKAPIDEAAWRTGHNHRHHQYTNIAGEDPDLDFGVMRLSPRIPYRFAHRLQPLSNLTTWLGFSSIMSHHVTGQCQPPGPGSRRGPPGRVSLWHRNRLAFLRKFAAYYGREYALFPAIAGPFFWKVCLGNWLSELGRDVYAGAIIYCGHVGARDYPAGEHAHGRAAWYARQAEAASDVQMPLLLSILCGGLDLQIEHHLYPRLPPNRLREISPRVRAICEAHGVRYQSDTWPRSLRNVLRSLRELASP